MLRSWARKQEDADLYKDADTAHPGTASECLCSIRPPPQRSGRARGDMVISVFLAEHSASRIEN